MLRSKSRKSAYILAGAVAVAGLGQSAQAVTKTWISGTGGANIDVGTNWSGGSVPAFDGTEDILLNGSNPYYGTNSKDYAVHSLRTGTITGSLAYLWRSDTYTGSTLSFNNSGAYIENNNAAGNYIQISPNVVAKFNTATEVRSNITSGLSSTYGAMTIASSWSGSGNVTVTFAAPATNNFLAITGSRLNHAGELIIDEGQVNTIQLQGTVRVNSGGLLATTGNLSLAADSNLYLNDGSRFKIGGSTGRLSYTLAGTVTLDGGAGNRLLGGSTSTLTGSGMIVKKGSSDMGFATGVTLGYTGVWRIDEGSFSPGSTNTSTQNLSITPTGYVTNGGNGLTYNKKITGDSTGSTVGALAGSFNNSYGHNFGATATISPGTPDTGSGLAFEAASLRFVVSTTSARTGSFAAGSLYVADITGAATNDVVSFEHIGSTGSNRMDLANLAIDVRVWTPASSLGSVGSPVSWTIISDPETFTGTGLPAVAFKNADGSAIDTNWHLSAAKSGDNTAYIVSGYYAAVPEPASLSLLGLAGPAMLLRRRSQKRDAVKR